MKKRLLILFVLFLLTIIFGIIAITREKKEWIKFKSNPVLGDKSTGTLFDPNVIIDEYGNYRMYVSNRKKGAISVSISKDGIKWGELKEVLNPNENNGWEKIINRCSVIYKDNKYYMWYTGQEKGNSKIGIAISDDGYDFKRIQDEPIIIPEFEYEGMSVMNPCVIYDNEEKVYKMWYSAGETYEPDVICYATSRDGINWEKYNQNPIFIHNDNPNSLDRYKIGGCEVHKINNKYVFFYIGYTDLNTARIFYKTSNDGVTDLNVSEGKMIVEPTKKSWDQSACYKPTVSIKDKKCLLWYNGRNNEEEYIGLVTNDNFQF